MKEYEEGVKTCPHCGYVEGMNGAGEDYLAASTILQGRYIVGKLIEDGEQGSRYIGYDALLERRVFIYEMFDEKKKVKFLDSDIRDDFQVGAAMYIVTDYMEEFAEGYIGDLPAEDIEVEEEKKSNKKILFIVAGVLVILLLILLTVLKMNPIEEDTESVDAGAVVELLETMETEEETKVEETEIEVAEDIEVEETEIETEAVTEETPEEEVIETEEETEEEVETEEIETEVVVETIVEVNLVEVMNCIGGSKMIEFAVANFWKEVGYDDGVVTGDLTQLGEDVSSNNINSDVATKVLKEEISEDAVVIEGVITVLVSEYDGDYILAPYWFTFEMDEDGMYSVTYEEVVNTASKVTASYELADSYGSYNIGNVIDGNSASTWSPEVADGNYALFEYSDEKEIYGVLLLNGYWKSSDTYTKNGRVTEIEIATNSYEVGTYSMNTAAYNSSIADEGIYNYMLLFDEPVTSSELYIILEDSINGTKYVDVCVSEILVIAR